ncbi:MAG TPA: hypothetical protein VLX91_17145 [Candidatus Acidoferrales bacterium]|nr:hypothetical protein [Candidatus Acidoferrales bacterium]
MGKIAIAGRRCMLLKPLPTERIYHYLHTDVSLINDDTLKILFAEIVGLRGGTIQGVVLDFLVRSLHPYMGDEKRKPFEKTEFLLEIYLPSKIGELWETEIYKLCIDLALFSGLRSAEDIDKMSLYVLLNRTVPRVKKAKKRRTPY